MVTLQQRLDTDQAELPGMPEFNPEHDAAAYLSAREELRERRRELRDIEEEQERRRGRLESYLKQREGVSIRLAGFDDEIYLGTRTRRRMAATGDTVEKSAVMVRKITGEKAGG